MSKMGKREYFVGEDENMSGGCDRFYDDSESFLSKCVSMKMTNGKDFSRLFVS